MICRYICICTYYFPTIDCPEDTTLGLLWERLLTKTTYKHNCSDIHPSFKFADTITRDCLKNRTWAPVDISQCALNNDSQVIMIVTINLQTENTSLVKSREETIIEEVKLLFCFRQLHTINPHHEVFPLCIGLVHIKAFHSKNESTSGTTYIFSIHICTCCTFSYYSNTGLNIQIAIHIYCNIFTVFRPYWVHLATWSHCAIDKIKYGILQIKM